MKKVIAAVAALATAGSGATWYWPHGREPAEMRLPGTVEVQEVRLGSKAGGRVVAVHAREGQVVEPGAVLVTFDAAELAARRDRARHKLCAAEAARRRADAGPQPEEVAEAKGAADAARARAAKMHAGARDEEKDRARHDLDAALADERQADDDHGRLRQVYGSAAGGAVEYQTALARRDRARSRTRAARAALDLAANGYRAEEVAEADAELAKFDARYDLLRKGTRDEDKAAAAAAEAGAAAELAEAAAQWREAVVLAPERCRVEVVAARAGDLVPAGQPVVRVLRADDLWVKAFVPATDLGRVRVGQGVAVTCDSYPGRRFAGEVTHVAAVGEYTPRNVQSADERRHQVFAVRVRVADPGGVFKSGMAAEVFLPAEGE